MREHKARCGEALEERISDMEATVEDYSGPITDTEEFKGSDLYVIGGPKNPVFTRIVAGAVKYSGRKDKLAVNFEEADLADLVPENLEAADEATSAKNDFLLETTGHDTKSHRDSMKYAVEDNVPDV